MGEYIGDRKPNKGGKNSSSKGASGSGKASHTSGETRVFDYPSERAKSTDRTKSAERTKSANTRRPEDKKPSSGKSGNSPSSQKKPSGSASKTGAQQKRPTASKSAYDYKTRESSKSTSRNEPSSKKSSSAPSNNTRSGKKTQSKPSNTAKSRSDAFSDMLSEKRRGNDERALHSSEEARRIHRERKQRSFRVHRKLYNFMYYAAIFVAIMAVILIMSVTVLFGIEDINVVAEDGVPYSDAEIVSSCDIRRGQNLFTAPVDTAGEQIMSTLPYIEECTVRRKLPSTIVITATAAQPVGIVRDADGAGIVVSSGLRALDSVVSSGDAPGVPVIEGMIAESVRLGEVVTVSNPGNIELAAEIVSALNERGITIDKIFFSPGGNITAVYDNRINMYFGTSANLRDKIELAAIFINEGKITKRESGDLDLSINGIVTFSPDYLKLNKEDKKAAEESE